VFEALLKLLARELDRAQIAYMVVGGQAVKMDRDITSSYRRLLEF
jgi:hypothetical protein